MGDACKVRHHRHSRRRREGTLNAPALPRVAVVGAGPAGLMAAERLAAAGAAVTVYDRMPSVARKFLLAGRGGLNLTHSEALPVFLAHYREAAPQLGPWIEAFPPDALRAWCEGLGEPTFVGTSGRVFPRSFKASPLLRAWLKRLDDLGVTFAARHRFDGFGDGALAFTTPSGPVRIEAEAAILALGGASWPRLGSDGGWARIFTEAGIEVAALKPSNCGFVVNWTSTFRDRFQGHPLKGARFEIAGHQMRAECMITAAGLEGGAIYALSPDLRERISKDGRAPLQIDLKPDLSVEALALKLGKQRKGDSTTTRLRKVGLSAQAIGVLRESSGRELPADATSLARAIKHVELELTAPMPMARAISSAGGVTFSEIDGDLMLRAKPGIFICGEMLDWEAPTGGYLLQACFATGVAAARGAGRRLGLKVA